MVLPLAATYLSYGRSGFVALLSAALLYAVLRWRDVLQLAGETSAERAAP